MSRCPRMLKVTGTVIGGFLTPRSPGTSEAILRGRTSGAGFSGNTMSSHKISAEFRRKGSRRLRRRKNVAVVSAAIFAPLICLNAKAETQQISHSVAEVIVEHFVKEHLRDPESAQFSNVHGANLPTVPGTIIKNWSIICGDVNSKNGFGGYAGAEGFVVIVMSPTDAELHFARHTKKYDFATMWKMCSP